MPCLFVGRILYVTWLFLIAGFIARDGTAAVWWDRLTHVQFTVGRSTTYIEQPRRSDGVVDYLGAFNEPLNRVRPEDNAAALLMSGRFADKPFVPPEISKEYYRLLGTKPPKSDAPVLWNHETFLAGASAVEIAKFKSEVDASIFREWTAAKSPKLAELVERNKSFLTIAVEASRRPKYHAPFVGQDDPPDLMKLEEPDATILLRTGRVLALRAMQKVGEKNAAGAMQDIEAIRRFALLLANGDRTIEGFTAACRLLDYSSLTESELLTRRTMPVEWHRERINTLTSMNLPNFRQAFSERDRLYVLAAAVYWCEYGAEVASHQGRTLWPAARDWPSRIVRSSTIDGSALLQSINRVYDEVATELGETSLPKRAARLAAMRTKCIQHAAKLAERGRDWTFAWAWRDPRGVRTAIGDHLGEYFGLSTLSDLDVQHKWEHQAVCHLRLLVAAHLLRIHKLQNGDFPRELAELKADPKLLIDPATDEPLAYKSHRNRAYLASAGPDGKRQAYLGPRPRFMQALSTKKSDDGDDITFSFD